MNKAGTLEVFVGSDEITVLELYGTCILWRYDSSLASETAVHLIYREGKRQFLCEVIKPYPCVGSPKTAGQYDIHVKKLSEIPFAERHLPKVKKRLLSYLIN